jgi:DNA mismatch repair protein MutL
LGKELFANLMPISFEDSYIKISGFTAKPQMTTRTLTKQYIFVNQRRVTDKGIVAAVKSSYGTLIEKTVYPIYILFLTMPYEVVDVNVHPKKDEVRVMDHMLTYDSIQRAFAQTLAKNNITFNNNQWDEMKSSTDSFAGKLLKEQKLPWTLLKNVKTDTSQIIQIHNLYLLAATTNGMAIIDQHAAHERILYEQFLEEFLHQKKKEAFVTLPKPQVMEFGLSESELLLEHEKTFEQAGFIIEHFKGTTFLLTALPKLFHDRNYKKLIQEMLEDLEQEKLKDLDTISYTMLAYLACRGAIKAGDPLTKKQGKDLLEQLEKTPNNATCPHGRPTKMLFDLEMIHKLFKR